MNDELFLKRLGESLETAVSVTPECLARIRDEASRRAFCRARRRFLNRSVSAGLLAATLAVAFIGFWRVREPFSRAGVSVETAIALLSSDVDAVEAFRSSDGGVSEAGVPATAAEMVLAWQDAPYRAEIGGCAGGDAGFSATLTDL